MSCLASAGIENLDFRKKQEFLFDQSLVFLIIFSRYCSLVCLGIRSHKLVEVTKNALVNDLAQGQAIFNKLTQHESRKTITALNVTSVTKRNSEQIQSKDPQELGGSQDCAGIDPNLVEDCTDSPRGVFLPSCAANAVRLAVARSLVSQAEKYVVCAPEVLEIVEVPESSGLKSLMLRYVQILPDGTEIVRDAAAPSEAAEWRMADTKKSTAGGASQSHLFRSENNALWLKTMDATEMASWRSAQPSYMTHFHESVRGEAPRSFLARILGVYIIGEGRCPEQCWVAMLDVVPYQGGGKAGSKSTLTCDVKPHMLSASPRSYESLDACGALLHSQSGAQPYERVWHHLEAARADTHWLSKMDFVDVSWLLAEAEEGAIGAVQVRGSWWHVGIIDFFMGYGWKSHGLQGFGRQLESHWKAVGTMKVLPKGPYSNRVWADPSFYAVGKFNDFSAKQFQVFAAFVACVPASAEARSLIYANTRAEIRGEDFTKCDDSIVPFKSTGVSLRQRFAAERMQQCQEEVADICQRIYQNYAQPHDLAMSQCQTIACRSVLRSKIRREAEPQQLEFLLELDQKQTQEMAGLDCVWNSQGRAECAPWNKDTWISSGCIKLLDE